MAESFYDNTLADQIFGSLYALLYYTGRKRILGASGNIFLANGSLVFALHAKGLQFAVQRRSFHADETCGARDIAAETGHLRAQILPFELLAGIAQR